MLAAIQPAALRCKGATPSLGWRPMVPGHLSGNAWHLKSRHPFVHPAQQLISSSDDNNRSASLLADHRWNADRLESTTRLRTFTPCPPPWNSPAKNSVGPSPVCTNGTWLLLWVVSGAKKSNRWQCCLPISTPSISPWMALCGWLAWRFWVMRQSIGCHLPRYLVQPSSGLKELAETMMMMKHLVLAYCRHSHLKQPRCAIFTCVEETNNKNLRIFHPQLFLPGTNFLPTIRNSSLSEPSGSRLKTTGQPD